MQISPTHTRSSSDLGRLESVKSLDVPDTKSSDFLSITIDNPSLLRERQEPTETSVTASRRLSLQDELGTSEESDDEAEDSEVGYFKHISRRLRIYV